MRAELVVCHSTGFPGPEDLSGFVQAHARGGLTVRSAAMFADAIARGAIIAILDEAGAIAAMSGILPLKDAKFEAGGALVRPDMSGFGLQSVMLDARIALWRSRGLGAWPQFYTGAAHADYGQSSRQTLAAAGFAPIPYEAGPVELREECKTCDKPVPEGKRCCYQFFRAPDAGLEQRYQPGEICRERRHDGARLILTLPPI